MSKSLQEQLLDAGLVSTRQVKQANVSKSKRNRQQKGGKTHGIDENRLEIENKAAQKTARDLALNRSRERDKERRELDAQIKQLAEEHQIAEDNEGQAFHFDHQGIVKKVYVSESVRLRISNGQLAIVSSAKRYRVVPADIALKIKSRDESALILWHDPGGSDQHELDPNYAKYEIPDDLIW